MRVRWTTDAANDLERICDYIAETSSDSARRIAQAVVERSTRFQTADAPAAMKVLASSKYCESFTARSNGLHG
jgi:plasmid stabilization system protein ParE